MGSNMQRQAVPLLITEPPIVGPAWSGRRPQLGHGGPGQEGGTVTYVDADAHRDR
jgi:DNA-directed RNA polymerase beta subunit